MKKLLSVFFIGSLLIWWLQRPESNSESDFSIVLQTAFNNTITTTINATGVIKPKTGAEIKVGSQVSGVVEAIFVDIGDQVEAGQLLAKLDDTEMRSQLIALAAKVDELIAQLKYSENLLKKNSTLQIIAETEIDALVKNVSVARARLAQAKANFQQAKIRLSYTDIIAPIAGTIASVSTNQGETVAASFAAPTFLTIVDLQRLEIQAYVDEADIGQIRLQQTVSFNVDTYSQVEFHGTVRTIYPKAEIVNNVVNYIVIIDIEIQPDYLLRPEMTTRTQFVSASKENALTIPRTALLSENGIYNIVLSQNEIWKKQAVSLGLVNNSQIEITQGLAAGDRYVSNIQAWLDLQSQQEGN